VGSSEFIIDLTVKEQWGTPTTITALIGVPVIVKNLNTNEELEFSNLTEAGKYIGVSRTAVRKYLDTGKSVKNQYILITKNK